MWPVKTPQLVKFLYPSLLWNFPTLEKDIYLTFDDGPVSGVTDKILSELDQYNAKATFFCVGENVTKEQSLFTSIKARGHSVGNHTYNHLNGWKVSDKEYFNNIEKCDEVMGTDLFRPPYGKISSSQISYLRGKYKIVMWDVLSFDFKMDQDSNLTYNNVVQHAGNGSIILFHDSLKAKSQVLDVLPRVLDYYCEKGFKFRPII